jgi:hypothetical protein
MIHEKVRVRKSGLQDLFISLMADALKRPKHDVRKYFDI